MSDLKNKKEQIKKLVLTLVMGVFAFGMSAGIPSSPSDCVKESRALVQAVADEFGDDLNGEFFDFYISAYMLHYTDCVNSL